MVGVLEAMKYSEFLHGLAVMTAQGHSGEQVMEQVTKLAQQGDEHALRVLKVWNKEREQGTSINSFWTRSQYDAARVEGVHPDAK